MADSNPTLQHAIPLGRGRGVQEVYHFGMFLRYIGKDGKEINPWATGEFVAPEDDPNYDYTEPLSFQPGKVANLPYWDKEALREILAVEDFARPGMAGKIKGWVEDNKLESYDLIAKVKAEGGLVTLKDFGAEPEPEKTDETQTKQGG